MFVCGGGVLVCSRGAPVQLFVHAGGEAMLLSGWSGGGLDNLWGPPHLSTPVQLE